MSSWKNKKAVTLTIEKMLSNLNFHALVIEMQHGTSSVDINLTVS